MASIPTWVLVGTQISIFSLGIAPQSSRSIFSIACYTSPPECAARNSDSTFTKSNSLMTPDLPKTRCFLFEECYHSPSCSNQKPGDHPWLTHLLHLLILLYSKCFQFYLLNIFLKWSPLSHVLFSGSDPQRRKRINIFLLVDERYSKHFV